VRGEHAARALVASEREQFAAQLRAEADRVAAATLRKMAGEGSAEVVAGPGVQQEVA